LRTVSGQAFLCTVPSVSDASKKQAEVQADQDALVQAEERERGVQHGLALLKPMRQGCLYHKQGWFTYSFWCVAILLPVHDLFLPSLSPSYGNEIRQFHQIYVPGSPGPTEDPHTESYVLAVAPEPTALAVSSGSPELAKKEAQIPSKLGGGDGAGWEESGKYLTQTWSGGTICDKTGLPRSVEVQVCFFPVCFFTSRVDTVSTSSQFHCNTQTIDRIALIRETSSAFTFFLLPLFQ
jgi:hypothetical protein